jgi:hypothetical protein
LAQWSWAVAFDTELAELVLGARGEDAVDHTRVLALVLVETVEHGVAHAAEVVLDREHGRRKLVAVVDGDVADIVDNVAHRLALQAPRGLRVEVAVDEAHG